jgi:hypothetical protein
VVLTASALPGLCPDAPGLPAISALAWSATATGFLARLGGVWVDPGKPGDRLRQNEWAILPGHFFAAQAVDGAAIR